MGVIFLENGNSWKSKRPEKRKRNNWGPFPFQKKPFYQRLSWIKSHWDCCKTPRSRHSSQHYRSLLSVSEENIGETKRRNRSFATVPGIWESLLEEVITEPDYEWLMIDASHIKVHPHGTGAVGGNQAMNRTKGGSIQRYTWPWIRMVCRSDSLLQKVQQQTVIMRHH